MSLAAIVSLAQHHCLSSHSIQTKKEERQTDIENMERKKSERNRKKKLEFNTKKGQSVFIVSIVGVTYGYECARHTHTYRKRKKGEKEREIDKASYNATIFGSIL